MTAKHQVVFVQFVDNTLFGKERIVAELGEAAQCFAKCRGELMYGVAPRYAALTQNQPGRATP